MPNEIIDAEFETIPSEPQEPAQEPAPAEQAPVPEPIIFDVDPALLVGEFLKDKDVSDDDSLNLELFLKGNADGWRFKNIPAPSLEELKDLELQVSSAQSQQAINAEAKQFLNDTDKIVLRHRDQKELSIPTKLSEEEFQALLVERQAARDRVI